MRIELLQPAKGEEICLLTAEQKAFIEDEQGRAAMDGALTFQWFNLEKQGVDCTCPRPVRFAWRIEGEREIACADRAYLLISECPDMSGAWVYATEDCFLDVYNLKIGTRYFWCVQSGGVRSEVRFFDTLDYAPRMIRIEGISNVRDMGGYKTGQGRIRQGLVYRGGEFECHMQLAPSGMEELCRLGVRTELDMRGEVMGKLEYTAAEAIGIQRVYVPSVPYEAVFRPENRDSVQAFFKVFADPANYPIYFHCWGGADRTGTFALILGAYLGMSLNDLICEYELTGLSIWGVRTRNYGEFQRFLKQFDALPGKTLRQKATTFLRDFAGLSDRELAVIRDTLTEA